MKTDKKAKPQKDIKAFVNDDKTKKKDKDTKKRVEELDIINRK